MFCKHCGAKLVPDAKFCNGCGNTVDAPAPASGANWSIPAIPAVPGVSYADRKAIMDQTVANYVAAGYRVLSRTDTTAQMVKPKTFSCLIATIWLLLFILPLIIYIFMYMAAKDETVYLEVLEDGHVRTTRS